MKYYNVPRLSVTLLFLTLGIIGIVNAGFLERIVIDDGNVMEHVDEYIDLSENDTTPIQKSEKGTLRFGRIFLKPFLDTANFTANRIGKAFNFASESAGLDTNATFFSGAADSFKNHIKMIYPGTRWCGDGNKARGEDDLGTFEDTDKCCRAHDKCFDAMAAGEKKYGLQNTGLFTRSHCECDQNFYNCLKSANDLIARKIGFTYFSILGPQCFKEEYFLTGCIRYSRGKCMEYRTDLTKGKLFQWFDSPLFI